MTIEHQEVHLWHRSISCFPSLSVLESTILLSVEYTGNIKEEAQAKKEETSMKKDQRILLYMLATSLSLISIAANLLFS